jgi:hypothetical protein
MQQLRDQPGRWAQVATYTSLSSAGSAAKNTAKKTGSAFEWVGRSDGAGSALYGRFVGDE